MKYIIIQGDGMADFSQPELGYKTPLEAADTPNMDRISSSGRIGLIDTIPAGLTPGSSVGNMSLMGLDPKRHFTGRAPLEARGLGLNLGEDDLVFRCNLVKLNKSGDKTIMEDYSGGHIDSSEASSYIENLNDNIDRDDFSFYPGLSYRNLLVWEGGRRKVNWRKIDLTPPHDISGEPVNDSYPSGEAGEVLHSLQMKGSRLIVGKNVNAIWFWGAGVKPDLPTYKKRYGLSGSVISAVDLIRGLGSYAGLEPLDVPGATGFIDTNYSGKVNAALENLKDDSLVYLHVEAPDEASHLGDLDLKIEAIERIDRKILKPLIGVLQDEEDVKIMLATDHVTSVESKTHEAGAVPFAISDFPLKTTPRLVRFSEANGHKNERVTSGRELLDQFIARDDIHRELTYPTPAS